MSFWGLFAYHISNFEILDPTPVGLSSSTTVSKAPDSEEISTLSKTTNPISTTSSNEIGWAQPFFPLPAPHGWFKYHETKRNMRGRFNKWERKCHIFSTKSMETKKKHPAKNEPKECLKPWGFSGSPCHSQLKIFQ